MFPILNSVLHDTQKPTSVLLSSYPRGSKELTGLFSKHFTPTDMRHWFESRGVELKTESDGRMFPITDSSQTIMDTIEHAALKAGVKVWSRRKVLSIEKNSSEDTFMISSQNEGQRTQQQKMENSVEVDCIILATGSSKGGYELAESLGHSIIPPVPSLFTLSSKEQVKSETGVFNGLSGVSVPWASVTLKVKG